MALLLPRFLLLYAPQQHMTFGSWIRQTDKMQMGASSFKAFLDQSGLGVDNKKLLVTNQLHEHNLNHYLQLLGHYGINADLIYRTHNSATNTKLDTDLLDLEIVQNAVPIVAHLSVKEFKKNDLVLIDLQNSGLANDEALKNLIDIMQFARRYKKQVIVLDRPNPLGCLLEGPSIQVVSAGLVLDLPLRYGLSIGELASYANAQLFNNQIKLVVLPLKYYLRNEHVEFEQKQRVYTLGLFDILRGVFPIEIKMDCNSNFQCLALPEYVNFSIDKWYELRSALWHYHIDVSLCRFLDRKTQQYFVGIRLAIDDINRVSYLKVWQTFFKFMHDAKINLRSTLALEQLFGTIKTQELITGNLSDETIYNWNQAAVNFYYAVKPHLIYRPWPIKVLL